MIIELVGALVVGRFNKTHLELDLKINWTSGVKKTATKIGTIWNGLSYYKLPQLIYYKLGKVYYRLW